MSIKEPPLNDIDIDWYVNEGLEDMNEKDDYLDEQALTEYVMNLIEEKFNLIDSLENLDEIQVRVTKKCIERINKG
ncbi:MAG: hypothetical protein ACKVHA_09260 [Fidelibacterota bacterium]|jgi:hypothetical protein|tara:strand:+ start:1041 stop:1268 length:228 start_codon:yes stop_codon:yes gene_type:complete